MSLASPRPRRQVELPSDARSRAGSTPGLTQSLWLRQRERTGCGLSSHLLFTTHGLRDQCRHPRPASPASTSEVEANHPLCSCDSRVRQPAVPVSTGKPDRRQASMPPSTLTAVTPCPSRKSATTAERAPTSQTTYSVPSPRRSSSREGTVRMGTCSAPTTCPAAHSSPSRTSMTRSPRSRAACRSTMLTSIRRQPFTFALLELIRRDDVLTASNADAGIRLSWSSRPDGQWVSEVPWKYQGEPLSASTSPYVFMALRMTFACVE